VRAEEKSLDLWKELLDRFAVENAAVLDVFAGTASLGIACFELGYKFFGCEPDKECFRLAAQRLFETYKVLYEHSNFSFYLIDKIPTISTKPPTEAAVSTLNTVIPSSNYPEHVRELLGKNMSDDRILMELLHISKDFYVDRSTIKDAGEGLFAKRDLKKGLKFYNI
jgi:hypothetical protein